MRRAGIGLHVQEVQADPIRELASLIEREQRVVRAVLVEVRGAVGVASPVAGKPPSSRCVVMPTLAA